MVIDQLQILGEYLNVIQGFKLHSVLRYDYFTMIRNSSSVIRIHRFNASVFIYNVQNITEYQVMKVLPQDLI
jgi:hypothetical protein